MTGPGQLAIGLLGCGLWGRNILRELLDLGASVAVADPSIDRRREASALGACAVAEDWRDLGAVEAYIVATPASTHAAVIEAVLDRDVPVFSEKPFTLDAASARRLAERGRDRMFVLHVWRHHPAVERLAEIARSEELGPVRLLRSLRVNWTSPRTDCDPIWTLAPHDLSIALEVLGRLPEPRSAVAEQQGGVPCGLVAVLGEDPAVIIDVSTRHERRQRLVRLHCERGVAVFDGVESRLWIARGSGLEPHVEELAVPPEPALRCELRRLLAFLRGGPGFKSSAADACGIVATLCELRSLAGLGEASGA